jgi:hypothetical protein
VTDTITSRGVTFARPTLDEKSEQAQILLLIQTLGGRAYVLGSRRAQYCGLCGARNGDQGTRQTEGLGDLAVYLPPPPRIRDLGTCWVFLWIECKGRGGTLSPEQVAFREINQRARVPHIVGGLDAVLAWLQAGGWIKA